MSEMFTEKDIDNSEELIWTGKQSYSSMLSSIVTGVVLAPFGIGLLILVNVYTSINYTSYAITDKALYKKKGVFSDSLTRVPLNKIQNTEYSRSAVEKQFGYGTVEISTAGSDGTQLRFRAISDAKEIQEKINSLTKNAESIVEDRSDSLDTDKLATELRETRENIEGILEHLKEE